MSSSACPRRRARRCADRRPPVAPRHGLRARSEQRVRSTQKGGSTCASRTTGCVPRAQRSAPTTGSASRRRWPSHDDAVVHGPLELLFTVSEEQGLDGAKALDPSLVSGSDTRQPRRRRATSGLTVRVRGKRSTHLRLPLTSSSVPADHVTLRVEVAGAKGGHSGERHHSWTRERDQGAGASPLAAFEAAPFEFRRSTAE